MSRWQRAPVVVGFDLSRAAESTLDRAVRSAQARRVPLWVVHVREPGDSDATDVLAVARLRIGAAGELPEVFYDIICGSPVDVLRAAATGTTMLVVGAPRPGMSHGAPATVAISVAATASVPVLAVRDHAARSHAWHPHIVVALDGSKRSAHALAFAFEEACLGSIPLRVLHVCADNSSPEYPAGLCDLVAVWTEKFPHVPVETCLCAGDTVAELVQASIAADLIVLAGRPIVESGATILGSVGHGVLMQAHCDVAVVN